MSDKKPTGKGPKSTKIIPIWWIYVVIGGLLLSFQFFEMFNSPSKISSDEGYEYVENGDIRKV